MNARKHLEDYPPTRRTPRTTNAYDDGDTMVGEEHDWDETPYTPGSTVRSAIRFRSTTDANQQPPAPDTWQNPRVPPRTHATTQRHAPSASHSNRGLVPVARQEENARSRSSRRRRWHPLFFVGVALCIMVLGFVLIQAISGWWQTTLNQWQYGYPRTFQMDAVVGHNDSESNPSHFIALNLHGHVQVIEYPGGDITHARLYVGPTLLGAGSDLAPVPLTFRDVNGDGKLDMIISAGSTITVMINDAGQFRPLKPGEQVTI